VNNGPHPHEYRPDIDGLRALAVVAVVGFHAFPRGVAGGFVGVDVFFVVSGYLISGILFRERDRGSIDLADFYARRIRRIFPALAAVLAAVAAMGWFVLTNDDLRALEKHIAGGAFFASNFVLLREAGYFDAPSRLKPLLHLWSLGIEEQFYLLWPPLVYACWKWRANVGRVAAAIVAASFAASWALGASHPDADFYLPATRMWELLVGALLAYQQGVRRDPGRGAVGAAAANLAAAAGLALIIVAAFVLTRAAPYPGWRALLPVAGTAAVIWAGESSWINRRLLAWRPVVYVGLVSYPLYLWHWPLLSFLQITEGGAPSANLKTAAIAVAFALAALTYHLVERPIRAHVSRATPSRVAAIVAVLTAIGGASVYARSSNLLTSRVPRFGAGIYSRLPSPRHDPACERQFPSGGEYCQLYAPDAPVTTALVGDSHAEHFLLGVGARLAPRGENVVHLGQSGCPPLVDLERHYQGGDDTCRTVDNAVIDYVAENRSFRRVILSFKGVVAVNGHGWDVDAVTFTIAGTKLSNAESIQRGLETTARRLVDRGKETWLVLQVPELFFDVPECFPRPFSFSGAVRTPCASPRAEVDARQRPYRQIVSDVQRKIPQLRVFDPTPYLCDDQWCHAIVNGELLYVDESHLSREGSLFFADKFPF